MYLQASTSSTQQNGLTSWMSPVMHILPQAANQISMHDWITSSTAVQRELAQGQLKAQGQHGHLPAAVMQAH